MRFASTLIAGVLLAIGGAHAAAGTSLLFIGNSFTFGADSPVQFYRADTVTDLNNEGIGGVPALFKSFTSQAGLDYDVSLETRGGSGLDFHLENKLAAIGSKPLGQGRDARPEHARLRQAGRSGEARRDERGRWPTSSASTIRRSRSYLTATWSRADQTYPGNGRVGRDSRSTRWRAMCAPRTTRPPPACRREGGDSRSARPGPAPSRPGSPIRIRTTASRPARSTSGRTTTITPARTGYYLEALVVFGTLTGRDPRVARRNGVLGLRAGPVASRRQGAAAGRLRPARDHQGGDAGDCGGHSSAQRCGRAR